MFVPIQYKYLSWSPPHLTPREEATLGEKIATLGKAHFRRDFRKDLMRYHPSPEEQASAERFRRRPKWVRVLYIAFFVCLIGGGIIVAPALLLGVIPITAFILLIYFGSLGIAVFRYDRWLSHCLRRYKDSLVFSQPKGRSPNSGVGIDASDLFQQVFGAAKPAPGNSGATKTSDQASCFFKTQPPTRMQRSPKVAACIMAIESDLLRRPLSEIEEQSVADQCARLIQMALGEQRIVIRLIKLELVHTTDILEALRRAEDRWQRDHNRYG